MTAMRPRRLYTDQSGMVSIVVTMIIMVILSLIVIGFARVSRREQRQGLDRQLASQAYYAAESGVNDAQTYLKNGGTLSTTANTTCNTYAADNGNALPAGKTDKVGSDNNVTSCVLVNNAVTSLAYDGVGTDEEVVFPVQRPTATDTVTGVQVSWQDTGSGADYTNCPTGGFDLVPQSQWQCPAGALRMDIVPVGSSLDRNTLVSQSVGILLYPKYDTGSNNLTYADDGLIRPASCSTGRTPRTCVARIALRPAQQANRVFVRLRPVYKSANIHVVANAAAGASQGVSLIGAQAVIDSTGRATDVLKRIVVRVPTCPTGVTCGKRPANYALQLADTLCKQYGVIPPSTVNDESSGSVCGF